MKVLREDIRKNSFEELQHQKANIQFLMSYFQNPIPLRSCDIIEFENLKNIIINSLNSVFNNLKNENIQENKKGDNDMSFLDELRKDIKVHILCLF